jgi:protein-arginine kinase activator protein McsA
MESEHGKAVNAELALDIDLFKKVYEKELNKPAKTARDAVKKKNMSDEERELIVYDKIIKLKEKEMNSAVKNLDFETAAILRDEIVVLKNRLESKTKEKGE